MAVIDLEKRRQESADTEELRKLYPPMVADAIERMGELFADGKVDEFRARVESDAVVNRGARAYGTTPEGLLGMLLGMD